MRWLGLVLLAIFVCPAAYTAEAGARAEFFEKHIRPLFVQECYKCHSIAGDTTKGGLALDTKSGIAHGGDSEEPVVVAGSPEKSLLLKAVRYVDPDLKMPPKHKLTADQIADLTQWIREGAYDPRVEATAKVTATTRPSNHWAFQPVRDEPPPATAGGGPTAIDRFINAKIDAAGLTIAPPTDRRTLIRRATYDLIGLPPTPAEVEAFLNDTSPDAFAKVVDRLLASPQYGEHWGRYWLDLARYADTAGESADFPIPQAWRYRNYVIDSFNADLPYDEFLKEQLAGDLMTSKDEVDRERKIIATGFIALSKRFGVDPENQMHLTIDDTIDTMGKSMLGLTLGCARCHDHKFDPITSREYYSLYGFFASTKYAFPGAENHKYQMDFVPLAPPDKAAKLLAMYHAKLEPARAESNRLQKEWEQSRGSPEEGKLYDKWQAAMKVVAQITSAGPGMDMAFAVSDGKAHDVSVLKRGEPYNYGEKAPRAFLAVLGGQVLPKDCPNSGRLQLANWIASPSNPLTARVMVNRIWQHHFGHGIVRTPSDFGTRGERPTHPRLLDFLAKRFVDSGWSIKSMHREIMLTDAYQRSSLYEPAEAEKDANNDLLARFDRRRLEAEEIRDSILDVAGTLDTSEGHAHPFPPATKWNFTQHSPFVASYDTPRRSVYVMQQRSRRPAFFATFDGPDPNATTAVRTSSTTPLQALYMMNDPFVHAQSEFLARRLSRRDGDQASQIREAIYLAYGRPAREDEVRGALSYEGEYAGKLDSSANPEEPLAAYLRVVFASNEFFYID